MVRFKWNCWQARTNELYSQLESSRLTPPAFPSYKPGELGHLPSTVQDYFRKVLKEGQPAIAAAYLEHDGTFNLSETGDRWKSFTSTQRVVSWRPGFVWDARIRLAPAIRVFVRDAYVAGRGILEAKLFGLLKLMEQPATPQLAEGELMRFLAEAIWYPTMLLPRPGLAWEAENDLQAAVVLVDGGATARLIFKFDTKGLVKAVRSEGRYRQKGKVYQKVPWQGRFWNYERRHGMLIPLDGEVAWLIQGKARPYWRGRIQEIAYDFAQESYSAGSGF